MPETTTKPDQEYFRLTLSKDKGLVFKAKSPKLCAFFMQLCDNYSSEGVWRLGRTDDSFWPEFYRNLSNSNKENERQVAYALKKTDLATGTELVLKYPMTEKQAEELLHTITLGMREWYKQTQSSFAIGVNFTFNATNVTFKEA